MCLAKIKLSEKQWDKKSVSTQYIQTDLEKYTVLLPMAVVLCQQSSQKDHHPLARIEPSS